MRPICPHPTHLEKDAFEAVDTNETIVYVMDKSVWFICPKNHLFFLKEECIEKGCLCDILSQDKVQCG